MNCKAKKKKVPHTAVSQAYFDLNACVIALSYPMTTSYNILMNLR